MGRLIEYGLGLEKSGIGISFSSSSSYASFFAFTYLLRILYIFSGGIQGFLVVYTPFGSWRAADIY